MDPGPRIGVRGRLRQADEVEEGILLGRLGAPNEIGYSAVYILEHEYFSGRVLDVVPANARRLIWEALTIFAKSWTS